MFYVEIRNNGQKTEQFQKVEKIEELMKELRHVIDWSMPLMPSVVIDENTNPVSFEVTNKGKMLECIDKAEPLLKELRTLLKEKTEEQA